MKKQIWNGAHFSCDSKKVFGDTDPLTLLPEEIDEYCRKADVVWQTCSDNKFMVHGCGINCHCHGGIENKYLRPRGDKYEK